MKALDIKPGLILHGPLFPEPVQVIVVVPMGASIKLVGKGVQSNKVYEPILNIDQLALLTASPTTEPFDGDAHKFRFGIEAMRLGLAYEYDPYFALSIARVDPLPHQLEAVYDYFLKTAAHSLSAGRRSRRRQDDHGRASHQGAENPRARQTHPDRHPGQS